MFRRVVTDLGFGFCWNLIEIEGFRFLRILDWVELWVVLEIGVLPHDGQELGEAGTVEDVVKEGCIEGHDPGQPSEPGCREYPPMPR